MVHHVISATDNFVFLCMISYSTNWDFLTNFGSCKGLSLLLMPHGIVCYMFISIHLVKFYENILLFDVYQDKISSRLAAIPPTITRTGQSSPQQAELISQMPGMTGIKSSYKQALKPLNVCIVGIIRIRIFLVHIYIYIYYWNWRPSSGYS